MVTTIDQSLKKLATYENSPAPILSVYLTLNNRERDNGYLLSALKKLSKKMTRDDHSLLQQHLLYINTFLASFPNTGKYQGLAIFAGGDNLWEIVTTHFPLPNNLYLSHSPQLSPIQNELQAYNRYLILLADRQKVRFVTLYQDSIETKEEFRNRTIPQKVKGRNQEDRQDKIDRHIQDHLHRHFLQVVTKLGQFVKNKPVHGIIIGGHKPLLHTFEKYLPTWMKQKIVGELSIEPDSLLNEILIRSKEIISRVEKSTSTKTVYTFNH